MSFLGSIGYTSIMTGLGLQYVLETTYASIAVKHMVTGKAVSRAVHEHILLDTALHIFLMSETLDVPTSAFVISESDKGETSKVERVSDDNVNCISTLLNDVVTKLSARELTKYYVCEDT